MDPSISSSSRESFNITPLPDTLENIGETTGHEEQGRLGGIPLEHIGHATEHAAAMALEGHLEAEYTEVSHFAQPFDLEVGHAEMAALSFEAVILPDPIPLDAETMMHGIRTQANFLQERLEAFASQDYNASSVSFEETRDLVSNLRALSQKTSALLRGAFSNPHFAAYANKYQKSDGLYSSLRSRATERT